jgi:hypothetical protein
VVVRRTKTRRENSLELGNVTAMAWAGQMLGESNPLRWVWFGQAAKGGLTIDFRTNFAKQVQEFECGSGSDAVVFLIGRTLNGNVDFEKREIFRGSRDFANLIGPANTAISFYKSQLSACRRAVETWSLCCLRLNIDLQGSSCLGWQDDMGDS